VFTDTSFSTSSIEPLTLTLLQFVARTPFVGSTFVMALSFSKTV
jgi:hypothetical protein